MQRTKLYTTAPLVLVFALLTGCTEASTAPLLRPDARLDVTCIDPTGPGCDPDAPPPGPWQTFPTDLPVEQVKTINTPLYDEQFYLYGDDPKLQACEIGSKIIDAPDPDGYTKPTMTTRYSATCPASPCYPDFLNARAAFHSMLSAGLLTGATIGSAFLGPVGQGVRIYASSRFAVWGLTGYATWASYNQYRVANGNFRRCVGDNYAWFNVSTVLR